MNTKFLSSNPVRLLFILALVIPLAMGVITPVKASYNASDMVAWGYNGYGQLNIPSNLTDVVAIDANYGHNLALKSDGTVMGWGYNYYGQLDIPSNLTGVVAISAGEKFSLSLKSDGTIVGWGDNTSGQLNIPSGLMGVTAISAGSRHSLALKSDHTVVAWGFNTFGEATVPSGLTDVVAIAAGSTHSLALKSDGTVVAWGYNPYGQTNVPSDLTCASAIDASFHYSLALKCDGTVVGWGWNQYGQTDPPPDLIDVVAISAGMMHNLALKSDGTVVAWGDNENGQATIPSGLAGVAVIAAGGYHNLVIVAATNTAPTANAGGPYLGAVNTTIVFDGSLSSDPENDPLTYAWTFGDGATGSGSTPTHTYAAAGLYDVCLTVNDGTLSSSQVCTLAVVYDPSAGFVTGGGWIESPAGAYIADPTLAGRATFGFMSKYQKGSNLPTGNTAFQFDLAGMAFASTSYDWLVVNQAGTNAQFKGSGLINGTADANSNAFKFMLWAGDSSPDTFRIRIWSEDAAGEHDVYDNGTAQAIGAGNIVIHSK